MIYVDVTYPRGPGWIRRDSMLVAAVGVKPAWSGAGQNTRELSWKAQTPAAAAAMVTKIKAVGITDLEVETRDEG